MLKDTLLDSGVIVHSFVEYMVVRELYMIAGVEVWPWHKGYKEPAEDDKPYGYYVVRECGFMKELYPIPMKDDTVLTVGELFDLVSPTIDSLGYWTSVYLSLRKMITGGWIDSQMFAVMSLLNESSSLLYKVAGECNLHWRLWSIHQAISIENPEFDPFDILKESGIDSKFTLAQRMKGFLEYRQRLGHMNIPLTSVKVEDLYGVCLTTDHAVIVEEITALSHEMSLSNEILEVVDNIPRMATISDSAKPKLTLVK